MKLTIARDTDDINSRFKVYDSKGAELCSIKGKDSASIKRLKAFDNTGACLFRISVTPEIGSRVGYNVVTKDYVFGITAKLKADTMCLRFHGIKLYFKGNIITRDFEITDISQKVLSHHKTEPGTNGCYSMNISDDSLADVMIAVAVCADMLSFADSAAACRA